MAVAGGMKKPLCLDNNLLEWRDLLDLLTLRFVVDEMRKTFRANSEFYFRLNLSPY